MTEMTAVHGCFKLPLRYDCRLVGGNNVKTTLLDRHMRKVKFVFAYFKIRQWTRCSERRTERRLVPRRGIA